MTDTYDEQIEALLAGDVARFITALGEDAPAGEIQVMCVRLTRGYNLFGSAWVSTPRVATSLFANLPGYTCCASQIEEKRFRKDHEGKRLYELVRSDAKMVLHNPEPNSKPTREILNEFARRQRLCQAA